jgi:hypothetical protein
VWRIVDELGENGAGLRTARSSSRGFTSYETLSFHSLIVDPVDPVFVKF